MKQGIEEPLYYTSVYDLPLYNFIQISLYNEHEKWLVKPETWEKILTQYSELSGDKNMSHMFNLVRQITYLTNRLNVIELLVKQLNVRRIQGLVDLLKNDLGFKLTFDDLQADLKRVVSLSKADVIKLKLAQKQYDDLKSKSGGEVTESDWIDEISVLSKFQGYAIKQKETTVGEYLSIKKEFSRHIEQIKKNNKPI